MEGIITKMLVILTILLLLTFISHQFIFTLRFEQIIGEYFLKKTPVGSSRNDVRMFVKKKGYKIMWDTDFPHGLRHGSVTVPEQPPRVGNSSNSENSRGANHIYVCITGGAGIVSVMCAWVFDEEEKLLFVSVSKEWNTW
jgi:hypothetical protein